jgi:hypothetical protein
VLAIRNIGIVRALSLNRYSEFVQRPFSASLSKLPACGGWFRGAPSQALLAAGVVAGLAGLLAGCGSGADLVSTVALPSQQSTGTADGVDMGLSTEAGPQSGKLDLTPAQRGYLDDLAAAGVHPSSELRALSIGSYVCQARGAGQGDQAVQDYVAPMVRSDVAESNAAAPQSASVIQADAAIDDYIRIAGQRLC